MLFLYFMFMNFFLGNYQQVGIAIVIFIVWVGNGLGDIPSRRLNIPLCCHLPLLAN